MHDNQIESPSTEGQPGNSSPLILTKHAEVSINNQDQFRKGDLLIYGVGLFRYHFHPDHRFEGLRRHGHGSNFESMD